MYMAFITRASQGESDNSDIIEEIRKLRYSIYMSQDVTAALECEKVMSVLWLASSCTL